MDMHEINERLKDILASEGESAKDCNVAHALGISPNAYAQMKFRDSIPYKEIMDFLAKRRISINLFFYNQELRDEPSRYKILRLFSTRASLGGGAWSEGDGFMSVLLDSKIVEHFSTKGGALDIIACSGDSMEPYILDGDLCVIARDERFANGDVYAIDTPTGVVIKRIYQDDDRLILISHNPLYAPAIYYECECEVVGKVVGIIRGI